MPILRMRVVDFESTGLAPPDGKLIEAGFCDVWWDTDNKAAAIEPPVSRLFSPGESGIPPEASAVHHLTMDDVAGCPEITDADLRALAQEGQPYALVAHQWGMEGQWLTAEITGDAKVICTLKAAKRAWEGAPSYSNSALRYWRGLKLDPALAMPPHRAAPDAYVTAHLLVELLTTEKVRDLVNWTAQPMHYPTCPLFKWKGRRWEEVDFSYLKWILGAPDMDPDIKHAANAEINRRAEHQGA